MTNELSQNQLDLLLELSAMTNIVVVTDTTKCIGPWIFSVQEYRTPTRETPYLFIRGFRDITGIISANSLFVANNTNVSVITDQVDRMKANNGQIIFSSNFQYIIL